MSMMSIRAATPRDREAIRLVEEHAFGQQAEAGLVDALVADGDAVVELVAEEDGQVVGHILFSRLYVEQGGKDFRGGGAGAAGGRAVVPRHRHRRRADPRGAYPAEGCRRDAGRSCSATRPITAASAMPTQRAAKFESDYQGEALQALAWGEAPETGRLVYASAFAALAA